MNFGDGVHSAFAEEVHRLQPDRTYELVAVFSAPSSEVESVTLRAGPFGRSLTFPSNNRLSMRVWGGRSSCPPTHALEKASFEAVGRR